MGAIWEAEAGYVEDQWDGGELKRRREGRGWMPAELAGRLGVSERTIWRLEAGDRRPSAAMVAVLAAVFRCSMGAFFQRSEERQPVGWISAPYLKGSSR